MQFAMDEDFARLVDDADVHRLGMQIDAAVECVLLCVESHRGPTWKGANQVRAAFQEQSSEDQALFGVLQCPRRFKRRSVV